MEENIKDIMKQAEKSQKDFNILMKVMNEEDVIKAGVLMKTLSALEKDFNIPKKEVSKRIVESYRSIMGEP